MRGFCYATAKAHARARLLLIHAGLQIDPHKLVEMLPLREDEYGVIPGQNDDIDTRRNTVAARMLLPNGASYNAVKTALETLLGDDFVKYHPVTKVEAVTSPTNAGDQPMHFAASTALPKTIRLLQNVTVIGSPQTILYEPIDTPTPIQQIPGGLVVANTELLQGESLVVGAGLPGQHERVTISQVILSGTPPYSARQVVATFGKAHPIGTLATTGNYPYWLSSKRHNLIVLTATAAADPEKRRKVNELLDRMLRGVSTWDIVAESSPGFTGPFTVEGGLIGITTIGLVTL